MNEKNDRTKDLIIRALQPNEIEKAEEPVQLAFGAYLNILQPLENSAQRRHIAHRYYQSPKNVLAAELDEQLVGINALTRWGSFAFFGPLAVKPDLWNGNIGTRLVKASLDRFESEGVRHLGLFIFADSPKHLGLYHKFGFCSRFLTPLMEKEIRGLDAFHEAFTLFSDLSSQEKEHVLEQLQGVTHALHPGLDLESEIRLVDERKMGDTLLVYDDSSGPVGFAVCQTGANTEAGLDRCYVKFGAVLPDSKASSSFQKLIRDCEKFADEKKYGVVEAGINLAHNEAFDLMLSQGYRISFVGVAMQKPNESAHVREGTFVLEDWR